nr:hypothetical protein [Halostagnicola sp. A56]
MLLAFCERLLDPNNVIYIIFGSQSPIRIRLSNRTYSDSSSVHLCIHATACQYMLDSQNWERDDHISDESVEPEAKSIANIDFVDKSMKPTLKFVIAFTTGAFFFLLPVQHNGQTTIPLDILMSWITETSMLSVELFILGVLSGGGILTTITMLHQNGTIALDDRTQRYIQMSYWETSKPFWAFRVVAIFLGVMMFVEVGPNWLIADGITNISWDVLMVTVALVIPLGGIFVNLLAELGGLQFIGTLAQPIMRPLFNLPGRSASIVRPRGSGRSASGTT